MFIVVFAVLGRGRYLYTARSLQHGIRTLLVCLVDY